MDDFERLLAEEKPSVERFVRYRIGSAADADDVLSEVYIAAFRKFSQLKNKDAFKAWIISIARNKCNDFFRKRALQLEIPTDKLGEKALSVGKCGVFEVKTVRETLELLGDKDKQILYLYFWKELPQAEIAKRLGISVGTVKSRLFTAKQRFKSKYPYPPDTTKGETIMKNLPEILPKYTIEKSEKTPFEVRHEELMGLLIVPRLGEKLSFGMYDMPERNKTGEYRLQVTGEVDIHGVRGVEIAAQYFEKGEQKEESTVFAQLTDTHCRYLGGMNIVDGVRTITTFLDGDAFTYSYAIGENNCGSEVERRPGKAKALITVSENGLKADLSDDISDIVGRFTVTLGDKAYDTVRLIDIQSSNGGHMLCEYYLNADGRTVLWRRFNSNSWAYARYGKTWTEMLPKNETLTVNGETYVHWYDCATDRLF